MERILEPEFMFGRYGLAFGQHAQEDFFIGTRSDKCFHSILLYYGCKSFIGKPNAKHLVGDEKRYSTGPEWVDLSRINKIKFKNPIDSVALIKKVIA